MHPSRTLKLTDFLFFQLSLYPLKKNGHLSSFGLRYKFCRASSHSVNVLQDWYFRIASRYPEDSIENKVYNDAEAYVQHIISELL